MSVIKYQTQEIRQAAERAQKARDPEHRAAWLKDIADSAATLLELADEQLDFDARQIAELRSLHHELQQCQTEVGNDLSRCHAFIEALPTRFVKKWRVKCNDAHSV
jgi:hypothetical protein